MPESRTLEADLLRLFRRKFDQALVNIRHPRIEASDFASIDVKSGRTGYVDRLTKGDRGIYVSLSLGLERTGGNLCAFDSGALGNGGQLLETNFQNASFEARPTQSA